MISTAKILAYLSRTPDYKSSLGAIMQQMSTTKNEVDCHLESLMYDQMIVPINHDGVRWYELTRIGWITATRIRTHLSL